MIVNVVNLVGWRQLQKLPTDENLFFCDSISMKLALVFFARTDRALFPGSQFAVRVTKLDQSEILYLTPEKLTLKRSSQVVLPFLDDDESFNFMDAVSEIDIEKIKVIVIGISSPAQNILAQEVQRVLPGVTVFCLGAMVKKISMSNLSLYDSASSYRLEFMLHMLADPKRFFSKVAAIVVEFGSLVFSRDRRGEFRRFGLRFQGIDAFEHLFARLGGAEVALSSK